MKRFLLFSALCFLSPFHLQQATACSMVCFVDESGQTWIGNNEDYSNPNTWMWTEPKGKNKYGSVFFGFGDFFPQGGINEAGLVFDGFAMPPLEQKLQKGKKKMDSTKLMKKVMGSCSNVAEVKEMILEYRLDFLESAQLLFADKSGATLIVEGDEVVEKAPGEHQICTNFYQSLIESHEQISCPRYLKAYSMFDDDDALIEDGKEFCLELVDAMHQESEQWGGTQYSNIYDPKNGVIYLYLFHNYEEEVRLNVSEVLATQKEPIRISALFQNTQAYDRYRSQHSQR
ncbi:linear amide C-N hydrolase [Pelagicoccus sp. SDUM812002]|uniref:linear amide C-N hydrolase n=1 Tax=Pelagicoccus sp. SDUM812002 TaxID=3041266 RepID=UPI00280CF0F4|nr:linear amide C-N hydrolase [Pelagicoccus sp. SDUM812002]MDQ8187681.1 hypothetical protein [Pelagicoccus sp. SDUM812002]